MAFKTISSTHRRKGLKMLVGFEKRKPVCKYIPVKFKKYFNDPTMQEGYWIEEKEQKGESYLLDQNRLKMLKSK